MVHLEREAERLVRQWSNDYISRSAISRIKKKDIARLVGVTPSAISQQFQKRRLSAETMAAIEILSRSGENEEKDRGYRQRILSR